MLFAVDVGNSHTVSGIFDKGKLVGNWRMQSRQDRTADELAIRYHGLFQMAGIDPGRITGFIVASVVPILETSWLHFARSYLTHLRQPPLAVNHTIKLGMRVAIENPAEVGADRIVNAVAAWDRFHEPLIVIDFGTAITFDCVNGEPAYVGGTIHPGIGISLDALATRTAKLPRLDIDVTPDLSYCLSLRGLAREAAIVNGVLPAPPAARLPITTTGTSTLRCRSRPRRYSRRLSAVTPA